MKNLPKFLIILLVVFLIVDAILFGIYLSKSRGFKLTLPSFLKGEPEPGSCLVLEEKYCKKAKLIDNPWIDDGLLAAYEVPKGAVLFSPVDGSYSGTPTFYFEKEGGEIVKYPGAMIIVEKDDPLEKITTIYSFIYFKNKESEFSSKAIKKGEVIDSISDKKIDFLGDYNLVVSITKQKHQGKEKEYVSESDNQQLKELLDVE